jgi:phage head maturation protease
VNVDIEYGNASPAGIHRRLELAFRGAPPEIRRSVGLSPYPGGKASRLATPPPTRRTAKPAQRFIGWLAGTLAPGVSRPSGSSNDSLRLREQLTFHCHDDIVRQARQPGSQIDIRLGHDGQPVVAAPQLTLRLHQHPLVGVIWEARLPASKAAERLLDAIGDGVAGCSIGFHGSRHWHIERRDQLRIVDGLTLNHIAVLDPRGETKPAYPAAVVVASRSTAARCPADLRREADALAWLELKRQHGVAN